MALSDVFVQIFVLNFLNGLWVLWIFIDRPNCNHYLHILISMAIIFFWLTNSILVGIFHLYLLYHGLDGRTVARSYGRSVVRSLGRTFARSYGRSVGCTVARSYGRSVLWSLGRTVARNYGRSVVPYDSYDSYGRSVLHVARSYGRSVVLSLGLTVPRTVRSCFFLKKQLDIIR